MEEDGDVDERLEMQCKFMQDWLRCIPSGCCETADALELIEEVGDLWAGYENDAGKAYDCAVGCGAGFNLQASVTFVFAALLATWYTTY
mmetsp:Transcript_50449/g.102761  ORF Transcript_50449/g.102761 Transcript_50449/m.102761 type:complete len:89 (-) Transcript_50449:99-365(-)